MKKGRDRVMWKEMLLFISVPIVFIICFGWLGVLLGIIYLALFNLVFK